MDETTSSFFVELHLEIFNLIGWKPQSKISTTLFRFYKPLWPKMYQFYTRIDK